MAATVAVAFRCALCTRLKTNPSPAFPIPSQKGDRVECGPSGRYAALATRSPIRLLASSEHRFICIAIAESLFDSKISEEVNPIEKFGVSSQKELVKDTANVSQDTTVHSEPKEKVSDSDK